MNSKFALARKLEGKVAIVAGAGSAGPGWSNGRAAAFAFAKAGATVLACDLDSASLEETKRLIADEGGYCETFVANLSIAKETEALANRAASLFPSIDILHNNIGIMVGGDVLSLSEVDWDRVLTANLKTMFLACKHVLPLMIASGGGVVINVGSIAGAREFGNAKIAYATSKAAVEAFTRSLAVSHGRQGIRAVTLTPGIIDTPIFAKASGAAYGVLDSESQAQLHKSRATVVPAGRLGTSHDVAAAAVFLASEDAAYISGTNLIVDGGFSCVAP